MKTLNVWAACKDPGGTNGILPVVDELRRRGHHVLLLADGWAATQSSIPAVSIADGDHDRAIRQMARSNPPHLFLTSTCSKGGAGMRLINTTRHWRNPPPTCALQDIWAGALTAEYWQDPQYRPDHILTPDRVGRDVMRRCWPDFDAERIHTVGFPAMDRYASFNVPAVRMLMRAQFKLSDKSPVLLFLGGGTATGAILQSVVKALNEIGKDVQLIVRAHPRMETDFLDEAHDWKMACASFRSGTLWRQGPAQIDDAIAAADLVVGAASTAQITAAIMGVPSISVMFPDAGERVYLQAYRGLLDEFPLDTMRISDKASDSYELEWLLRNHFIPRVELRTTAPNDVEWLPVGRAAARAVDVLERIAAS